ncbi:flagellar hook-length control protein FliK [Phyllobacterium sp. LjRoot231]|uniref:flagellar hook-length control protein FliK n=1 Tax=Phyllobacterium sp. LjRoot231 TaxID=3342289 RepID=UPI003ECDFF39
MPLRTMLDAIVRDKGKDDMPDQKPAKGKDVPADFRSMVKAAGPKLKLDKEDATPEKDVESLDTAEPDKDVTEAPAQGIFGQAILAFEQLLDRQQRENGEQPQPVTRARTSSEADTAVGPIEIVEADQGNEKQAQMPAPDKKSVPKATTDSQVAAASLDKQEPAEPVTATRQAVASATQASEAPKPKASTKAPVEHTAPPTVEATASTPSPSVQAEAKLSVTASNSSTQVQTALPVTDVQILSDHSTPDTRTLVIQLQPVELGTVTARMRLTPDGMHIQLMAENPAMAEHLAKDHDMLSRALQRAGVADDASSVTISVIDRSSASSNTQTGQQNLPGQDQQTGARASGGGQSGFQGTPGDRSGNKQPFEEMRSNERKENAANPGIETNPSHGLVV